MALIPLIAVFAYKCIKATFKKLTPINKLTLQDAKELAIELALFFSLGSCPVYATVAAGLDPKQSVHILVSRENRTPYLKSIALYQDFGICAQDGSLLKYNAEKDKENFIFFLRKQKADRPFEEFDPFLGK